MRFTYVPITEPQIMQLLSAFAQCTFQVLVPKFSESWFDLRGRTTATMTISIGEHLWFFMISDLRANGIYLVNSNDLLPANPIGSALGQLISPLLAGPSQSVRVLF